jgi:hypothetical protein
MACTITITARGSRREGYLEPSSLDDRPEGADVVHVKRLGQGDPPRPPGRHPPARRRSLLAEGRLEVGDRGPGLTLALCVLRRDCPSLRLRTLLRSHPPALRGFLLLRLSGTPDVGEGAVFRLHLGLCRRGGGGTGEGAGAEAPPPVGQKVSMPLPLWSACAPESARARGHGVSQGTGRPARDGLGPKCKRWHPEGVAAVPFLRNGEGKKSPLRRLPTDHRESLTQTCWSAASAAYALRSFDSS